MSPRIAPKNYLKTALHAELMDVSPSDNQPRVKGWSNKESFTSSGKLCWLIPMINKLQLLQSEQFISPEPYNAFARFEEQSENSLCMRF